MGVSASTRRFVRERAAFRCEYCHADERWQFVRFTIDHVVPRSEAGSDEEDNLALACRNCNERRSNRSQSRDPVGNEVVPLFNPRRDSWKVHFAWDAQEIHVVGLTPTGRATVSLLVSLLDRNDERHGGTAPRIRQRDREDGYHPAKGDPVLDE